MNIVLTGFMGTGKSAVGRRLAEDLHVSFFDADVLIAAQVGKTVAEIFNSAGEGVFRAVETQVIEELAKADRSVISTGGGALINRQNREHLQKNGLLVCLTARVGTLLERLKDDMTRPLLAGEALPQKIERLMKERQSVYDLCRFQVITDGKTIAHVAREIMMLVRPEWE